MSARYRKSKVIVARLFQCWIPVADTNGLVDLDGREPLENYVDAALLTKLGGLVSVDRLRSCDPEPPSDAWLLSSTKWLS